MKISKQLIILAQHLESSENPELIKADQDGILEPVAEIMMHSAAALRRVAEDLSLIEAVEQPSITSEKLDEMAAIATEFAQSEDELLQKQAAVLDDLLVIMADQSEMLSAVKQAETKRIEELKKKYQETKDRQKLNDGIKEAEKALEKSPMMKEYRSQEFGLSTRYCPSHHGISLAKIGDNWQCPLDGKIINFEEGVVLDDGTKIPGSSVQNQSQFGWGSEFSTFNAIDTRADRLGFDNQYK